MKKTIVLILSLLICSIFVFDAAAAVSKRYTKNSKEVKLKGSSQDIRSEVGLNIKDWGIAIDAIFDPRLDNLIPDYHIINIVLTNRRGEPIQLHTSRDKWTIVDSLGKKHTAYNHVKEFDKKLWPTLPKKMQNMLDYPHVVSPGKSTNIDIFLPKSVDLHHFREVIWKSYHFRKEFNVFTNYEKNLQLPNHKEFDTPRKKTVEEATIEEKIQNKTEEDQNSKTASHQKNTENTAPQALEINEMGNNDQPTTVEGFVRVK